MMKVRPMKVLIAEDNDTNRKLLRAQLEAEGHTVVDANDGVEALKLLEREKVDAIVSDILMPNLDGYRFCSEVRKREQFRDLPFIFYTNTYLSASDEKFALLLGGDRFFRKPTSTAIILQALKEVSDQPNYQRPKPAAMPEAEILCSYSERLVAKLEERNTELQQAKMELERRVLERTAQLEATNKELEAFSQSVAHDLRSPLRAINGFSHMLFESCQSKLDAEERADLERICAGTGRMEKLIDDLLNLSRVSRAELRHESIDLTALAKTVVAELQGREPQRHVELQIADGLVADGDPGLLRVVLDNLLSNAWKYTAKQPAAKIEFGLEGENGGRGFFIRDNGAGFDMQYAGKLFAPFQRLHGVREFPGTGVGLATVQRIIRRHGGRVWAEAEVNKGATFHFTVSSDTGAVHHPAESECLS